MKAFVPTFVRLALAALVVSAVTSVAACGDEGGDDDRQVSELSDSEYVAECNAQRKEAGDAALEGAANFACYVAATRVGGSCNANVFEQCVTSQTASCTAPQPSSPERTCQATLAEARSCQLAFIGQFRAYDSVSCTTPPTSQPKAHAEIDACDAMCAECPDLCAEVGI
jgi:hypothetical protein